LKSGYDRLLEAKHPAQIYSVERAAGRSYQLVIGPYADAATARTQAQAAASAVPSANAGEPAIQGPKRMQTGTYSTLEEARAQLAKLRQRRFAAVLAYHAGEAEYVVYSVWAGASASDEQLNQVMHQVRQSIP